MHSKAQGTIEYLVILAIVVVLGLVVVGISTNIFSGSSVQVSSSSGNLSNKIGVGGISVSEAVTDTSGDAIISLSNNSGENLTLTKITPIDSQGNAGIDNNYNTTLTQGDSKTFSLSNINTSCPCNTGDTSKTCTFKLTITTSEGLTKTLTKSITTQCVQNSTPMNLQNVITPAYSNCWSETTTPHPICTCPDLNKMREHIEWGYELRNDINCYDTINWNSGLGFTPIGEYDYCSDDGCTNQTGWGSQEGCENDCLSTWNKRAFYGTLNGNGKSINGLFINNRDSLYNGLFAFMDKATILNLSFTDVNMSSKGNMGVLAGMASFSTITDSIVAGTLSENTSSLPGYQIGGFVGRGIDNNFLRVNFSGTINGPNSTILGGIIGVAWNYGNVIQSTTSGTIYCYRYCGGILGTSSGAVRVTNSFSSTGIIPSDGYTDNIGGLAGQGGNITNSYSTGNVGGQYMAGGLIGYGGTTINSYSSGDVNNDIAIDWTGGFIGRYGTTENCFSTGKAPTGFGFAGAADTVTNSYWDVYRSEQSSGGSCSAPDCIGINSANSDPTYFYYPENEPLVSWGTWANVSGTKYSTTDGNWSICRGVSLPWLTWEGRSC